MKTVKAIKCFWCGQVLPLTKNGRRPKQHRNGATICVGSGQTIEVHENQHKLPEERRTKFSCPTDRASFNDWRNPQ